MKANKLKSFAQLLDFGADCLKNQKIHIQKLRGPRKVFFPMVIAAQNYSESIFSLCKENRTHACLSLLRSICDNHIKAKFLYCHPFKHCHVIFLDGVIQKRKQLNHAIQFLKANPVYMPQANCSIKDLSKSLKKVETQERKARLRISKYSNEVILDILEMAKCVDRHNEKKNSKSYSLEWIYILLFRQLSSSTHINFLDFNNYFRIEENEIVVLLSGNPDDVDHILSLAIYLYREMLIMFLRVFKNSSIKLLKNFID
jgi:hypothetical protein